MRSRRNHPLKHNLFRTTHRPERDDIGEMVYQCEFCAALFWIEEKTSGSRQNPKYNKCCANGKIKLNPYEDLPDELTRIITSTQKNNYFGQIRAFNCNFSFISIGAKANNFREGFGAMKIRGNLSHNVGSLCPHNGNPEFAQMYFYDTANEVQNRLNAMDGLDEEIVRTLTAMMRRVNPHVRGIKMAVESFGDQIPENLEIRIKANVNNSNQRTYNAPTGNEIAAIIPQENRDKNLDICLKWRSNGAIQQINHNHKAYDSLAYALLFPKGITYFCKNVYVYVIS